MYNSDLASDIEKAVQDALATSDFSKLNKNITSRYPSMMKAVGMSFEQVISNVIELAVSG